MMQKQTLPMEDLYPIIRQVVEAGGEFQLLASGTSMIPTLWNHKDTIVLAAFTGSVKKGDILLYRRDNGMYVIHRVVGMEQDSYVFCGDSQYLREHGIRQDQILARMTARIRKGKRQDCDSISFRLYSALWGMTLPFRKPLFAALHFIHHFGEA